MLNVPVSGLWEHVGFFHTEDQQFLAFAPPSYPTPGAVLRVTEGEMPPDWTAIYPTFAAFLDAYLRPEGHRDVAWPDFDSRGGPAAE